MKTQTIGDVLHAQRTAKHISLERLSDVTKIPVEHLKCLEANDFDHLPSATYVKGYIRAMARELSLDPDPLLSILRRDYKESVRGALLPRELIQPLVSKKNRFTPLSVAVLMTVIIVGVVVGYGLVQWYLALQPPKLQVWQPTEFAVVATIVEVQGVTDADASLTVNDLPVDVRPDGTFTSEVTFLHQGVQSITFDAVDRRGLRNQVIREVVVQF